MVVILTLLVLPFVNAAMAVLLSGVKVALTALFVSATVREFLVVAVTLPKETDNFRSGRGSAISIRCASST